MNTHNNIRDKKCPLFDKKCLCSPSRPVFILHLQVLRSTCSGLTAAAGSASGCTHRFSTFLLELLVLLRIEVRQRQLPRLPLHAEAALAMLRRLAAWRSLLEVVLLGADGTLCAARRRLLLCDGDTDTPTILRHNFLLAEGTRRAHNTWRAEPQLIKTAKRLSNPRKVKKASFLGQLWFV